MQAHTRAFLDVSLWLAIAGLVAAHAAFSLYAPLPLPW